MSSEHLLPEPDCVQCGDESKRVQGVAYCIDDQPVCGTCYLLTCSNVEWSVTND